MTELFAGVNWLGVALGALASFVLGWFWYSPKGFYGAWSRSAHVTHQQGDPMAAAFGSLVLGLLLYSTFVGVMLARGQVGPLLLGMLTFIIMGYSNNAFKKLGSISRTIDAGSWAASGIVMIVIQLLL
jgi:hypothetical protein